MLAIHITSRRAHICTKGICHCTLSLYSLYLFRSFPPYAPDDGDNMRTRAHISSRSNNITDVLRAVRATTSENCLINDWTPTPNCYNVTRVNNSNLIFCVSFFLPPFLSLSFFLSLVRHGIFFPKITSQYVVANALLLSDKIKVVRIKFQ